MLRYSIISDDEKSYVSLVHEGQIHTADSEHPNFRTIVDAILADDESVVDLFDVERFVSKSFERLSDRVSVSGGRVYLDGDEVDNSLTQQIRRFLDEGQDFRPLVNFFENIVQNPQPESREHLYRWLNARDFTITEDGMIAGYKGVRGIVGGYESIHSGSAIVDGIVKNGHIPNNPGSVIEMPRSEVAFDPREACSTGLHVGTYDYARDFGWVVLEVHVNPRDVVSVPADHDDTKMRVCRYTVVCVVEQKYDSALRPGDTVTVDDEYEECDGFCDCGCDEFDDELDETGQH